MMKYLTAATAACLLMARATAYGPLTETAKEEKRFFLCIQALEFSDTDGDDRLSRAEYKPFLMQLSNLIFGYSVLEEGKRLPDDVSKLYKELIPASGAEKDAKTIDIFGASLQEIGAVSQARYDDLNDVCDMVMKELADLGPPEASYHSGMLSGIFTRGKKDQEEAQDDEDEDVEEEMISVHSSFILHNKRSITKGELDLSEGGALYDTYVDFINELLESVCSQGIYSCDDEEDGWFRRSLLSRQLCGRSRGARRLRRRLCGPRIGGRQLSLGGTFVDAELYEVKDADCPDEFTYHENEHGVLPTCHTVYAHFDVLLEVSDDISFNQLEDNFIGATKQAIADGMLQESLDKMDPDSPFLVLGPGRHRYPVENGH